MYGPSMRGNGRACTFPPIGARVATGWRIVGAYDPDTPRVERRGSRLAVRARMITRNRQGASGVPAIGGFSACSGASSTASIRSTLAAGAPRRVARPGDGAARRLSRDGGVRPAAGTCNRRMSSSDAGAPRLRAPTRTTPRGRRHRSGSDLAWRGIDPYLGYSTIGPSTRRYRSVIALGERRHLRVESHDPMVRRNTCAESWPATRPMRGPG
jgi:hypothetical protein